MTQTHTEECIPGTDIPKPPCQLVGSDGNAYSVMGAVKRALRKAGCDKEIVSEYSKKAMSGDYNHLMQVSLEYVEAE